MQEQPEDNLMVAISRPWYNCSYTMAAKPIKSLELHYTMIQFLIIIKYTSLTFFSVYSWQLAQFVGSVGVAWCSSFNLPTSCCLWPYACYLIPRARSVAPSPRYGPQESLKWKSDRNADIFSSGASYRILLALASQMDQDKYL